MAATPVGTAPSFVQSRKWLRAARGPGAIFFFFFLFVNSLSFPGSTGVWFRSPGGLLRPQVCSGVWGLLSFLFHREDLKDAP